MVIESCETPLPRLPIRFRPPHRKKNIWTTEHLPPKNDENDETTQKLMYPIYKWIDISANRQVIKQFLNASSSQ